MHYSRRAGDIDLKIIALIFPYNLIDCLHKFAVLTIANEFTRGQAIVRYGIMGPATILKTREQIVFSCFGIYIALDNEGCIQTVHRN